MGTGTASNLKTNLKNDCEENTFSNYIHNSNKNNTNQNYLNDYKFSPNKKYDNLTDNYSFNNHYSFNTKLNESGSDNGFKDLRIKIKSMENNMEK